MLVRLVKLTLQPDQIGTFVQIFQTAKPRIEAFPGCQEVVLWKALDESGIVFTRSIWDDETALENYRASDLFINNWRLVKPLFAAKAEAWSVE